MVGTLDTHARFDAIVTAIYDAALDPTAWPDVLAMINGELGAVACGLRYQSFATGEFWQLWHDLDPAFERAYVEHYFRSDPWVEKALAMPAGRTFVSEAALSRRELERTAFFNELCLPHGMGDLVGGLLVRTDDELVSFGAMRRAEAATFEAGEAEFLARLLPHLRRAYEVHRRLRQADGAARAGWAAVEAFPIAVFWLDDRRRVVRANGPAERLLSDGDVLRLDAGAVATARADSSPALDRALAGTSASPVPLARASGRPLVASSIPVGRASTALEPSRPGTLLLVVDPDAEPMMPAVGLERLFGLTRAEARVALLIAGGRAPKEAAEETGRTWNTVRDQLKQVYAKTRTSGQTELVRLIGALGLLPPGG